MALTMPENRNVNASSVRLIDPMICNTLFGFIVHEFDEVSYHLWIQDGQMVIEEIDDEENEDENEEEEEIPLPW